MSAKIIFQSSNRDAYLKKHSNLMSLELNSAEIEKLASLPETINELPQRIIKPLLKDSIIDNRHYLALPVLTPTFTKKIADSISDEVREVAIKVANILNSDIEDRHVFLGTVVLGYLWQSILQRKLLSDKGGSAVVLIESEKCSILYVAALANGVGGLLTWLQTPLQKNNVQLDKVLNCKDTFKMIASINEDGIMTPYGEAAERLRLLRISRLERDKGGYVSDNVLMEPQISPQKINELKPFLLDFARMGDIVIDNIAVMSDNAYTKFSPEWGEVNKADCYQAFYYVFCYELMRQLEHLKVVAEWRKVPNV